VSTSPLELRIPPPLVMLIVAALMWIAARQTSPFTYLFMGRIGLAIVLAVVGVSIAVAGVVEFRKARTTINPLRPTDSTSIVTSGVYRITRNPMYLGMLVLLLAWAALLGNALSLILSATFVAFITRYQIRPEERILIAKFGRPYENYLRAVRRWL
jgi:protein-S-isoprenylcysteine O-methyltransferase Ste14